VDENPWSLFFVWCIHLQGITWKFTKIKTAAGFQKIQISGILGHP
jgi:hypothetical protein